MAKKREEELQQEDEQKKFKLLLEIKSGVEGIDSYIQETTKHFLEFDIKLMRSLIESMSAQSERVVANLFRITNQEDETIPTLDTEKADLTFSKLKTIVANAKEIQKFCEESLTTIQEIDEAITEVKSKVKGEAKIDNSKNIFEELQRKRKLTQE